MEQPSEGLEGQLEGLEGHRQGQLEAQQRLEGQPSRVVAPEALGAGDHVFVPRRLGGVRFQHHGIAVGAGHIAHYRWSVPAAEAAHEAQPARARIRLTSVADFLDGSVAPLHRVEWAPGAADPPQQVVARAVALASEETTGYNLAFRNCEHFARFCMTGASCSGQVQRPLRRAGVALEAATRRLQSGDAATLPPSEPRAIASRTAAGTATLVRAAVQKLEKRVAKGAARSDTAWRQSMRRRAAAAAPAFRRSG